MNNTIKKKIFATIVVSVISIQVLLLFCSAVYSCFTQNPKVLYYAICYQLEQNSDSSFHGKINSVLKGIQVYSTLNPLFNENDIKLFWINIWGYVQKKLGIVYFPGKDNDMFYLNNGYLALLEPVNSNDFKKPTAIESDLFCEKFKKIRQYLTEQNIDSLYIVFPGKLHQNCVLPFNYQKNFNLICSRSILRLKENNIPVIDTRELYKNAPDVHYELFYKGDHHWKPEYAYRVYIYISQELERRHSPMAKYFNRKAMAWEDYFIEKRLPPFHSNMGSEMRRVGKFFLPERDITPYLIPRYETYYTFQVPALGIDKTGSVNDTFLEFFRDEPIEIITNNRIDNNKIMVFHDSFIHSFVPFLATNNHCLYMIDLRHFHGNIVDLIDQEKPDVVLFAYHCWAPYEHIKLLEQQIQEKQKLNNTSEKD